MGSRNVRWLQHELPALIAQGVISPETAEKLKAHYADAEAGVTGRHWAVILFSIIGAVLIGSGIILILAYNWPQLSRPARTVVSFAPLVLGQILAAWVLWQRPTAVAWREGGAVFAQLSLGATIALIAQTYHMSDDFGAFMLTWMLLGLPWVYLLDAVLPAAIYLAGITAWAGDTSHVGAPAVGFWLLAALLAPHVYLTARKNRYHVRAVLLFWASALCLCVATGICLENVVPQLWIIVYAGLLTTGYLAGRLWFNEGGTFWQRPLVTVGGAGATVLAYYLTFEWPWRAIDWQSWRPWAASWPALLQDCALAALLPGTAIVLLVISLRHRRPLSLVLGVLPVLVLLGYAAVVSEPGNPRADLIRILFNFYVLTIGVATLVAGTRSLKLGTVNLGMAVVGTLILTRFFDSDIGFVTKGLIFIALGIGFLAVNVIISRRQGAVA